jgi:phenylacetate-coenzyme A ligase PaaK-like adenylate-forming protein
MGLKKYLYKLMISNRLRLVDESELLLKKNVTRPEREAYQVEMFNKIWRIASESVPFYDAWRKKYDLPAQISDLDELKSWPVLTKADLRDVSAFKRIGVAEPKRRVLSGGSTGEPIRLPSWFDVTSAVSQIIERRAYGIEPGDKAMLLWGHEHLYGAGFRRKINVWKRSFKDWLSNWKRVSAYDLGVEAMREAYRQFAKFQPKFVVGFSPAVLAFVRTNKDKCGAVKSVRAVFCSAGPLTEEEKKEIGAFFGSVVCMEYGSAECAIMAYTNPNDGCYDVFWNTHLLQVEKQTGGEYKNLVTRLTDCYVPLIRYDIGDYLEVDADDESEIFRSVLRIKSVKGRPSEMIKFKCGVSLFGALIGDCVKQVPDIISSQMVVEEESDRLEIRVTSARELTDGDKRLILDRLCLTVSDIDKVDVSVVQCKELFTTAGGKTPRVVRASK